MSTKSLPGPVDQNELRTGQMIGIVVLLSAVIVGRWEPVVLHGLILLLTAIKPKLGPYRFVYRNVLLRLGYAKPDIREDNLAAHRFAALLGFVLITIASYLFVTGYTQQAWFLVWLVLLLTTIAFIGWCAGCFTYYILHRMGLSRFFKQAPLTCTIPGTRPRKSAKQEFRSGDK